jgi:hypothetical protein
VTVNVFEDKLGFAAALLPGHLYRFTSRLEVSAFGGAIGAGRALFNNTFGIAFAGSDTNPFADPDRSTQRSVITLPPTGVPTPPVWSLQLLALAVLGMRGAFPQGAVRMRRG